MHDHHQVGRGLLHGYALTYDFLRQTGRHDGNAVLHEDLRLIDVSSGLEHHVDREFSVACRLRRDVEHVVDAVDLLLNRCRDGRGNDLGRCAGIDCGDVHRGRRDLRILGDRQRPLRDDPRDCQKY